MADEQKNVGLIRDLLLSDGSPTALGLAGLLAGGALVGMAGYALYRRIVDYFADQGRDLEAELGEKSAPGAHEVYR